MIELSDGVIAFAITLLVLNLVVPTLQSGESLTDAMSDLGRPAFVWALSFAVIALHWYSHHEILDEITGADWLVVTANFVFLALISTLPFTTDLLGQFGDETTATAIYALNIALLIASLILIEVVAKLRGLRSPEASAIGDYTLYVPLAVFALSIPVAFVDPTVASLMWILSALGGPIEWLVEPWQRPSPDEEATS